MFSFIKQVFIFLFGIFALHIFWAIIAVFIFLLVLFLTFVLDVMPSDIAITLGIVIFLSLGYSIGKSSQ